MFTRPEHNYEVSDKIIDGILLDRAHPFSCIAELIPPNSRVLDIGAGSGILARALNQSGLKLQIDGIEPNKHAATLAEKYYRNMYVGYAHEFYHEVSGNHYDIVVLADVIEHVPDPYVFLLDLLSHLNDKTSIILSVPNVAFGANRLALLKGSFEYVDSGLLERTHLRFFTRDTLSSLFSSLNLSVVKAFSLERSFYRTEFSRCKMSNCIFTVLGLIFKQDARAYQYLYFLSRPDLKGISYTGMQSRGVSKLRVMLDYFALKTRFKRLINIKI